MSSLVDFFYYTIRMIFFYVLHTKIEKSAERFFLPTNVENGQTEYKSYCCQLTRVQYL